MRLEISALLALIAVGSVTGQAVRLADIHRSGSSDPREFTVLRRTIFFAATHPTLGRELFKTDGTVAGTQLVKDIRVGPLNGNPQSLTLLNDKIYFVAGNATQGRELWVTDGSNAGTKLVKDIAPGGSSSLIGPMIVYKNRLFFSANDLRSGSELWQSDGTAAGTTLVKDLVPGPLSSQPLNLKLAHGAIYFNALVHDAAGNSLGRELCRSNGSRFGTLLARDFARGPASSGARPLVQFQNKLIFATDRPDRRGFNLWETDGFVARARKLTDRAAFTNPVEFGGRVWFQADEPGKGRELFVSDGTAAGTRLFFDIEPGARSSSPVPYAAIGGNLLFRATTATNGLELWATDGTVAGTRIVREIEPGNAPGVAPVAGVAIGSSHLVFVGTQRRQGRELWVTNGTRRGTWRIQDIHPRSSGRGPSELTVGGGLLAFAADDGSSGREPWGMPITDIVGGSFVKFGAGCRGTGPVLEQVLSNNKNGGIMQGSTTPARTIYALEVEPAATPLRLDGYEVFTESLTGLPVVRTATLHEDDGNGFPKQTPIASGTMRVDVQPSFCRVMFDRSITAPVRRRLYIMIDAEVMRLPRVLRGAGRPHLIRNKSSSTWIRARFPSRWSYRLLSSQNRAATPAIGNQLRSRIGRSYHVTLDSGKPSSAAVLVTGFDPDRWGPLDLPLDLAPLGAPGCDLLVSADLFQVVALDAIGGQQLAFALPNEPVLVDLPLYQQWAVLDASVNSLQLSFSEAARAAIGR